MDAWVRERFGSRGQSTLEYALVLLAFLSMVVALVGVWQLAQDGRLVEQARDCASHNADEGIGIGLLQDLASY